MKAAKKIVYAGKLIYAIFQNLSGKLLLGLII